MTTKFRNIGSLSVSLVGIGGNNFGGRLDEAGTRAVVDAAIDAGINFFDTADIYGETKSEVYLGKALGPRRKSAIIATKFGLPLDEQRKGARPEYVKRAVEDSLKRLGTDYIDLYQLHRPDPTVPIADTLGALNELIEAGKVREIGASNFSAEQLAEAKSAADAHHYRPFVSVQNQLSLLFRADEKDGLAAAEREGLAYLPYFPLASGLLSGKYRAGKDAPEGTRLTVAGSRLKDRFYTDELRAKAEQLAEFASARGHSLLELAFSWLAAHRAVASVIAGATSPAQVRANAAAVNWELTQEELSAVDAIAPIRAAAA